MLARIDIDIVKVLRDNEGELESLVLFPGGYQLRLPEIVFDTILEEIQAGKIPSPYPKATPEPKRPVPFADPAPISTPTNVPDPVDAAEDTKTRVCIECKESVTKVMPSGRCYSCALVRCPTCKGEAKAADMIAGQYCPKCLPREG